MVEHEQQLGKQRLVLQSYHSLAVHHIGQQLDLAECFVVGNFGIGERTVVGPVVRMRLCKIESQTFLDKSSLGIGFDTYNIVALIVVVAVAVAVAVAVIAVIVVVGFVVVRIVVVVVVVVVVAELVAVGLVVVDSKLAVGLAVGSVAEPVAELVSVVLLVVVGFVCLLNQRSPVEVVAAVFQPQLVK